LLADFPRDSCAARRLARGPPLCKQIDLLKHSNNRTLKNHAA
jgi:hypothetical protein